MGSDNMQVNEPAPEIFRVLPEAPFDVRSIRLFSFDFEPNTPLENASSDTAEISYRIGADVNDIEARESYCLFFAEYSVGKFVNEELSGVIRGRYVIVLDGSHSLQEWLPYVHLVAATVAWLKFSDLCSLLMLQANLKWPTLPVKPPGVEWAKDILANDQT